MLPPDNLLISFTLGFDGLSMLAHVTGARTESPVKAMGESKPRIGASVSGFNNTIETLPATDVFALIRIHN
jgi:hypothetical protein